MTERPATDQGERRKRHAAPAASPSDVAERWVSAVRAGDDERLGELYEVGAALHTADDVVLGQELIVASLVAQPTPSDADVQIDVGRQGVVTLTWNGADDSPDDSTRLRVRHGKIVEQWIGERHSSAGRLAAVPMNMSTSGEVTAEEHDLVWDMVDRLVSMREEPASYVEVRLTQPSEANRLDPVSLRVTIGLPGGSVRASARAGDVRTVTTIVERRLKHAVNRRAERRAVAHGQRPAEPSIRLEDATRPARGMQRTPSEREVVRHKTVSPGPSTFEEATFDLTTMGYDFFLYVDIDTDRDALVSVNEDGTFQRHVDPPSASLGSARDRLDAGNEPFVFFNDDQTGRGHVLYRRHDGHYGLIVPADD